VYRIFVEKCVEFRELDYDDVRSHISVSNAEPVVFIHNSPVN
jgi:hypothetical protein